MKLHNPDRLQAVDALLSVIGASGDEPVPVPSWHYAEPDGPTANGTANGKGSHSMPLRAALTRCYDLRSPRGDVLVKLLIASLTAGGATAGSMPVNGKKLGGGKKAVNGVSSNGAVANGSGGANGSSSGGVQEQLAELSRLAEDKGEMDKYLEPRHVIDILEDFGAPAIGVDQVR
jgi:sulfite reductase (NADPH) flavoprotein alpha-component